MSDMTATFIHERPSSTEIDTVMESPPTADINGLDMISTMVSEYLVDTSNVTVSSSVLACTCRALLPNDKVVAKVKLNFS